MEKTQAQIKLGIISVLKLVILTFVLSVSFCIIASAEESGYCGENGGANLQWTLDDDGVLTISGSGKMADYTWGDWNDYEGLSEEEIDELMNGEIGFAGYSTAPWGGLTSSTITSIVIESGVTSIGNCAFYTCSGVQEAVTVPDSVTSIGEEAFGFCISLPEITLPENITTISLGTFEYCASLQEITLPSKITSIGGSTFYYCMSLTSLIIPDGVTTIGDHAFESSGLTNITVPDSVTSIGEDAFSTIEGYLIIYCNPGSTIDTSGWGTFYVYKDAEAVRYYDDTVYYISGLSGVTETGLAGYSKCNLCKGDTVLSTEYTVYEGFEIEGFEFSAEEMGYSYVIGFKISDSGDDDVSADDIKALASTYSLEPVA